MKSLISFCLLLGLLFVSASILVPTGFNLPKIIVDGQKGKIVMVVYGDVIKAIDGATYRVTVTDSYAIDDIIARDVDMYSRDGRYAYISASNTKDHGRKLSEATVCTKEELVTKSMCPRSADMAEFVDSVVKRVMVRGNTMNNFEIYWSWSMGNKELLKELSSQ